MNRKIVIAAVISAVVALAGIAAFVIMNNAEFNAPKAEIYQNGELIKTVELSENTEFTVTCAEGFNVITVEDGKICVSSADCPDKICVKQGKISGAVPIVCLPHRLEIRVVDGDDGVDA